MNRKNTNRRLEALFALTLFLCVSLASSCGRIVRTQAQLASEENYTPANADFSVTRGIDANYNCPSAPNVIPDYDDTIDGSGRYTVCPSKTNPAEVLIHGSTSQSSVICVYPIEVVDESHIFTKPDLQTGAPLVQCYQASGAGIKATFNGVNWNAAFIIELNDRNAMTECLVRNNYYLCPNYSFGKFR